MSLDSYDMVLKVYLSNNPLDDYQRAIFTHTNNGEIDLATQWPVQISETSYKSKLVGKVKDIPILGTYVFCRANTANKFGRQQRIISANQNDTVLRCFEYKFPTVMVKAFGEVPKKGSIESILSNTQDGLQVGQSSPLKARQRPLVKNEVPKEPNFNGYIHNGDPNIPGHQTGFDSPEIHPGSINTENNSAVQSNSHMGSKDNTLHTPGCTIIWSEDIDFVFMTGIWRLYQEVIEGLISTDREYSQDNEKSKQFCLEEWDIISTNIFGRRSALHRYSSHHSTGKSSSVKDGTESTVKGHDIPRTDTEEKARRAIRDFDFKWERIDSYIRDQLLEYYRGYLIQVDNINPQVLKSMEHYKFAQKIRGGYTDLQGTWLPRPLARRLCLMFAYPIRYLLVPLFGATFPRECEKWYRFYEFNRRRMKSFVIPFDGNVIKNISQLRSRRVIDNKHNLVDSVHSNSDRHPRDSETFSKEKYETIPGASTTQGQLVSPLVYGDGSTVLVPVNHLPKDRSHFPPEKKIHKIGKLSHQEDKTLKNAELLNPNAKVQPVPLYSSVDGKYAKTQKERFNSFAHDPFVNSHRCNKSSSNHEHTVLRPNNLPNENTNINRITTPPVTVYSPLPVMAAPLNMGVQGRIGSAVVPGAQPHLYNQVVYPPVVYRVPPSVAHRGPVPTNKPTDLPYAPNIYTAATNYPPHITPQYMGTHPTQPLSTEQTNGQLFHIRNVPVQPIILPNPPSRNGMAVNNPPQQIYSSSSILQTLPATIIENNKDNDPDIDGTAVLPGSKCSDFSNHRR